jgi:hypothetical protein
MDTLVHSHEGNPGNILLVANFRSDVGYGSGKKIKCTFSGQFG